MNDTLYELFLAKEKRYGNKSLLAVPERLTGAWELPSEISYTEVRCRVQDLIEQLKSVGVGQGDCVALALESRPDYVFHYLALNALKAVVVPLNTDLTATELGYQLSHSQCHLIICLPHLRPLMESSIEIADQPISILERGKLEPAPPLTDSPSSAISDQLSKPAAILYTSGTTGKPKGCVLSNLYLQEAARYGSELPGHLAFEEGRERILNPLPLYHINSMVLTLGAAIMTGGCFVMPGRFSASNWWSDIRECLVTRFNYLGIMIPALMSLSETDQERAPDLKYGFGAGVDPAVHRRFEERFGIPLVECWGMTETGRVLMVDAEPRYIDTRACGRPFTGLEARIHDDNGQEVPDGTVGELVVRHSAEDPRHGFFDGYYKDEAATQAIWRNGWMSTGDLCMRSSDGMFTFVDRKKNIIRRSGENIACAEVEAAISSIKEVAQVCVLAAPDELRDEEVLACVVLACGEDPSRDTAKRIFCCTAESLALYKVPGWIKFMDALPVTGTQKVQKHRIFGAQGFSENDPSLFDFRSDKRARH
ncbi:AMP-binding protein [Variovorax paradoxus]|uniref:AMP-binding protein n=1 Tax=Variovorax paradoxus TaxID=34073 RepID=UPI003ED08B9C